MNPGVNSQNVRILADGDSHPISFYEKVGKTDSNQEKCGNRSAPELQKSSIYTIPMKGNDIQRNHTKGRGYDGVLLRY